MDFGKKLFQRIISCVKTTEGLSGRVEIPRSSLITISESPITARDLIFLDVKFGDPCKQQEFLIFY